MTQPVFRPSAAADVEDAFPWYESQRLGLGEDFRWFIATPAAHFRIASRTPCSIGFSVIGSLPSRAFTAPEIQGTRVRGDDGQQAAGGAGRAQSGRGFNLAPPPRYARR